MGSVRPKSPSRCFLTTPRKRVTSRRFTGMSSRMKGSDTGTVCSESMSSMRIISPVRPSIQSVSRPSSRALRTAAPAAREARATLWKWLACTSPRKAPYMKCW